MMIAAGDSGGIDSQVDFRQQRTGISWTKELTKVAKDPISSGFMSGYEVGHRKTSERRL